METWKNIKGNSGYEVSDKGNVRKVSNGKTLAKTVVDGKAKVTLAGGGKRAFRQVNQLVAEAFKPSLLSKAHTIKNIDGDPTNNSLDNLEAVLRGNNKYHDTECVEEGCSAQPMARGMCHTHYYQWYRHNAPDRQHRNMYEVVGYQAAHQRLAARKGKASQFDCQCGAPAEQWALMSIEAEVLYRQINQRDKNRIYSLNEDDYHPMCRPCHSAYDKKARGSEIQRFANCVQVSVRERGRQSDHDYEALVEQIKQANSIKAVADTSPLSGKALGSIFHMTTGQRFIDWKRDQKAVA